MGNLHLSLQRTHSLPQVIFVHTGVVIIAVKLISPDSKEKERGKEREEERREGKKGKMKGGRE